MNIEDWDMFIVNCSARVVCEDIENEEAEWYPSAGEEKEIGWLYYEELKVLELATLNNDFNRKKEQILYTIFKAIGTPFRTVMFLIFLLKLKTRALANRTIIPPMMKLTLK